MHVLRLWEEAEVPGENTQIQNSNTERPQTGLKPRTFLLWGDRTNRWSTVAPETKTNKIKI